MGTSLKKTLNEIAEFGLLSSSDTVKIELPQRYCQQVDELLEHLRPVCNEIAISEISDGKLVNMLEELEVVLHDVRDMVESWHPMMSKLYFVLQIESSIRKLSSLTLDVCELVRILLPPMEDDFPTKCIERIQDIHHEQISLLIQGAMIDQKETNVPNPERVDKISTFLNLLSNEELLTEAVAVEKLKATVGRGENNVEMQNIDRMNALVTYMHDFFVKANQLQSINGVPIPPDFCCPLSLQLMSDPVIVASGQTYERTFIKKWLDQGFTVCPKTRQKLSHTNLIPNYTVKALIANWCESNNIKLPDPVKTASSNLTPAFLSSIDASGSNDHVNFHSGHSLRSNFLRSPERITHMATSQRDSNSSNGVHRESHMAEKPASSYQHPPAGTSPSRIINGVDGNIAKLSLTATDGIKEPNVSEMHESSHIQAANQLKRDSQSSPVDDQFSGHNHTVSAANAIPTNDGIQEVGDANMVSRVSSDLTHYSSDVSGEVAQDVPAASAPPREPDLLARSGEARSRGQNIWRRPSVPRIVSSQAAESGQDLSGVENIVRKLVEDLKSDSNDVQRHATAELRLLARNNMENRIIITKCGAISLLVGLLHSEDSAIQENAVTALLNLSINDNNKTAIAQADAIDPLIHVLQTGSPEAKENAAATLFSLSVIEENKARIGRSGAIKPLVDLLGNGTPRGKKDAATALFNLSIFHENKARIVKDGAVKYLVELMDPAAGMVDKAVAVLSNLATIPEGRTAIGHAGGIPVLVEVVELGSARGKENAAAALLQLCTTSSRFCSQVIQEGAVPPLVALLQSGTPRAKEKAQTLLSYFKNQRHGNAGRG